MSAPVSLRLGVFLLGTAVPLQASQPSSPTAAIPDAVAVCPWLTEGTAANALMGEVLTTVTLDAKSQGVCTFTRLQGSNEELKISVGGEHRPSCPKDSIPVGQIGTHADQCSVNQPQQRLQQMISGAVREKGFAVSITTDVSAAAAPESSIADTVKQVAEIVAGNLF